MYLDRYRARGTQDTSNTYRVRQSDRRAVRQADLKFLPNGPHLTRVRFDHFFLLASESHHGLCDVAGR
jgi:hypothetical protein